MEARRSRVAALLNLEYTPTPQQLLLEAGKTLSFAICGRKLAAAKLIALRIYRLRSGAGEGHVYGECFDASCLSRFFIVRGVPAGNRGEAVRRV